MARPGELAEVIASVLDAPLSTVRQQARELRDAGLMSKERAGRGAGTLTSNDAAALLLAVLGALQVKDSADAVRRYGSLPLAGYKPGVEPDLWDGTAFDGTPLARLEQGHTALEALTAIIDSQIDNPKMFVSFNTKFLWMSEIDIDDGGLALAIEVKDILQTVKITAEDKSKSSGNWNYRIIGNSTSTQDLAKLQTDRFCTGDVIIEIANLLRETS